MLLDSYAEEFLEVELTHMPEIGNLVSHLRSLPARLEDVQTLREIGPDGRDQLGFRAEKGEAVVTLWVDAGTDELLRVELGTPHVTVMLVDFAFDVEVDESLFALTPPEGYTLRTAKVDVSQGFGARVSHGPEGPGEPLPPGVVAITPTESLGSSIWANRGILRAEGVDFLSILRLAYGVGRSRMAINVELPKGRFDVNIRMPEGQEDQLAATVRAEIELMFGIVGRIETRNEEVCILSAPSGRPAALRDSVEPRGSTVHGRREKEFRNCGVGMLAGSLEWILKRPVIDETGIDGQYDYEIRTGTDRTPEAVARALREQLGLELTVQTRPVDILVIEKREPATPPAAEGDDAAVPLQ